MKRTLALILPFAVVASAFGQSIDKPLSVQIHVGYGTSPSFNAGGDDRRLEGPEIGVAIPIGTALGQQLLLEPSFFGGGRFRHGGDDDADVYRLTVFAHRFLAHGIGFRVGVGYSGAAKSRGGLFDGTDGAILDVGAEFPLKIKSFRTVAPYVDVHGIIGTQSELSGFFAGIGIRL